MKKALEMIKKINKSMADKFWKENIDDSWFVNLFFYNWLLKTL